jgi:hypothetical protein
MLIWSQIDISGKGGFSSGLRVGLRPLSLKPYNAYEAYNALSGFISPISLLRLYSFISLII